MEWVVGAAEKEEDDELLRDQITLDDLAECFKSILTGKLTLLTFATSSHANFPGDCFVSGASASSFNSFFSNSCCRNRALAAFARRLQYIKRSSGTSCKKQASATGSPLTKVGSGNLLVKTALSQHFNVESVKSLYCSYDVKNLAPRLSLFNKTLLLFLFFLET